LVLFFFNNHKQIEHKSTSFLETNERLFYCLFIDCWILSRIRVVSSSSSLGDVFRCRWWRDGGGVRERRRCREFELKNKQKNKFEWRKNKRSTEIVNDDDVGGDDDHVNVNVSVENISMSDEPAIEIVVDLSFRVSLAN